MCGHLKEPAVGVGITVARDPLHGSGRAELPHPALASGNDAEAAQGIGMTNAGWGATSAPPGAACAPMSVGAFGCAAIACDAKATRPERGTTPAPGSSWARHSIGRVP